MNGEADPTDEALVAAARSSAEGDLRAFETLVERYQGRILANCRYLSGSAAEAEDLAQEVFVKAFFGLARFEGRATFSTWLQRIKVNHCLSHRAKKRKRTLVSLEEPGLERHQELRVPAQGPKIIRSRDQRQRISEVLDSLSPNLVVPLVLRDADGLSYEEIARQLGIGLSAVKMRIKRGREQFRRLYREQEDDANRTRADTGPAVPAGEIS